MFKSICSSWLGENHLKESSIRSSLPDAEGLKMWRGLKLSNSFIKHKIIIKSVISC